VRWTPVVHVFLNAEKIFPAMRIRHVPPPFLFFHFGSHANQPSTFCSDRPKRICHRGRRPAATAALHGAETAYSCRQKKGRRINFKTH